MEFFIIIIIFFLIIWFVLETLQKQKNERSKQKSVTQETLNQIDESPIEKKIDLRHLNQIKSQELYEVVEKSQTIAENKTEEKLKLETPRELEVKSEFLQEEPILTEKITFVKSPVLSEPIQEKIILIKSQKQKDIEQKITGWRDSGQIAYIPQLANYSYHPDPHLRTLVASALGNIAESKSITTEIQKTISILGKLSRDSDVSVRQSAIVALAKIKSDKVIPWLKIALRDSDINVVKTASAALNRFKVNRVVINKKNPKNKKLSGFRKINK